MLHRALTLNLLLQLLPAVALQAADIPIVGQVLGPGGEPRAKTEVCLEQVPPTYERAKSRLEGRAGPEPAACARTGADGTFELAAPEAGMWKVVVAAPGVLTAEHRLIGLVEAAVLPALKLTPAADLEVRMVDAEGKPLSGRIGAVALGARGDWRPRLRLAAAGEDGVARLPLGRGEKIQLELLADGHPLKVLELFDEASVEIEVPAGVAGTVRFTDRQKRPLAGAVAFQGSALLPLGLSDEQGRLPLVLQADKAPAVRVSTADRWNGSFELDFAAGGGSEKVKDLRLDPPSTIQGRVLDLSNRDPVAGALVWAVRGEFTVTDEQGRYALDDGVYKSRRVQAAAAGYQRGQSQVSQGEVPAIGLTPAASLAGKVTDSDGGLLEGVAINLRPLPRRSAFSSSFFSMSRDGWHGRTSSQGRFKVSGLVAGYGYRLTFTAKGYAPRTLEVEPLAALEARSGITVVLEPGHLATGRVVDEDDVPIAGAEIRLGEPPPTDDPMRLMRLNRSLENQAAEPAHLTDAEGRFAIADLAAGRYDLEVRAGGFAPAKVPGVRVGESGTADFGTVVLIPGASIEGRVTDPDGAAIEGAEVTADDGRQDLMFMSGNAGPRGQAQTDAEGRFVISELLPDQSLTLRVSKKGHSSESVAGLRPPLEEPLAIVLAPAGRIRGTVADRRGDPIQGARIGAHQDPGAMTARTATMRHGRRPSWAQSDADGRFLLEDVEPGTLQVTADADDYQQQIRSGIEMAAGADLELDFTLDAGAVVEGSVTTADGEPVAQAMINVTEQRDQFFSGRLISAGGQTDVDGRYRVAGAPTGPATINLYRDGGVGLTKNIEVRPGTNVVDLVLERGYEVSGQVVGPDGNPVGGAALSIQESVQPGVIHHSFGGTPESTSAADGRFALTGVKAGNYTVNASREGFAAARSEPFEVSGNVSGVLLELRRGVTLKGRVLGLEFDDLGALSLIAFGQLGGGMRRGRVDFSGEYAFDNLGPGLWQVQAQVAGSGRSTSIRVEIPEGATEVVEDIEFGSGFTLTGIVLDGGSPLPGVSVTATGTTGSGGHGMTAADGLFRIENLKPGSYRVMVMSGLGMQHTETLDLAGDQDLRIELSTGSITGRIKDVAGEPLAGAAVTLEQLDDTSLLARQFGFGNRAQSDSRGYFHLPRVRQGTWRVVATKAGYAPGETTVAVGGDGAPEIEIRLTPTEGVSFEVALQSGTALPSVQVALLDPASRVLARGSYPVIDGKVRVSTVPAGRWELVVQGGDSAATRFVVDAPGEQGRLVLPTAGVLQIRVPELEQVPVASVILTGPDGKPFVASMGISFGPGEWMVHGGQAMIPGLTPGTWSFTVRHEDRTWSGSAAVTPGATTEVSLP